MFYYRAEIIQVFKAYYVTHPLTPSLLVREGAGG